MSVRGRGMSHLLCAPLLVLMLVFVGCGNDTPPGPYDADYEYPPRSIPGRYGRTVGTHDGPARGFEIIDLVADHTFRHHIEAGPGPNQEVAAGTWSETRVPGGFRLDLDATSGTPYADPSWWGISLIRPWRDEESPVYMQWFWYAPGVPALPDK